MTPYVFSGVLATFAIRDVVMLRQQHSQHTEYSITHECRVISVQQCES